MIRTFDFLYRAWEDEATKERLLNAMEQQTDSLLQVGQLWLSFRPDVRQVTVYAEDPGGYGVKVIPAQITYAGLGRLIHAQWDDLQPGDIAYLQADGEHDENAQQKGEQKWTKR